MATVTHLGLGGPMADYLPFQPKETNIAPTVVPVITQLGLCGSMAAYPGFLPKEPVLHHPVLALSLRGVRVTDLGILSLSTEAS